MKNNEKQRKKRKKDPSKTLFRDRWDNAFSKLTPAESKRYVAIIQTVRIFLCLPEIPKSQIYLVKKAQNNVNTDVLEALEKYVDIK